METFYDLDNLGVGMLIAIALGLLLIILVFYILFYLTLYKTFKKVKPGNRQIEPGLVWLLFVPCLGSIWLFFVVHFLGKSIEKEFISRGIKDNSIQSTYIIGMIMAALGVTNFSFSGGSTYSLGTFFFDSLEGIVGLGWIALRIFYWVKIYHFGKELSANTNFEDTLDSNSLLE